MRGLVCLLLLAFCVFSVGCRSLFKKSPSAAAAPSGGSSGAVADRGAPTSDGIGGLLAGKIVDAYGTEVPPTYIQVVARGETEKAAPIEVAADNKGYFTIQGLKPGRSYRLLARAREGDRLLAGTTYATPPDARVVIRISEDFVSPNTPPPPREPEWPGTAPATKQPPAATLERPLEAGATPAHPTTPPGPRPRPPVDLGIPRAGETAPAAVYPTRPESLVRDPSQMALNGPRPATIPGPPDPPPPPAPPPDLGARVPSCLVANHRLQDFALYDLNGQPWEYRRQRQARLILLDFWATWCVPCQNAMPHLVRLQNTYGSQGLDVIGIAYEEGTPEEQARKVRAVRDSRNLNYQLLLGGDAESCPVKAGFRVAAFPTLILLDEQGNIVWKAEGLDGARHRQLEAEIRRRLGVR